MTYSILLHTVWHNNKNDTWKFEVIPSVFTHIVQQLYNVKKRCQCRDVEENGITQMSWCAARRYLLIGAPEMTGEHQIGNAIYHISKPLYTNNTVKSLIQVAPNPIT